MRNASQCGLTNSGGIYRADGPAQCPMPPVHGPETTPATADLAANWLCAPCRKESVICPCCIAQSSLIARYAQIYLTPLRRLAQMLACQISMIRHRNLPKYTQCSKPHSLVPMDFHRRVQAAKLMGSENSQAAGLELCAQTQC